MAKEFPLLVGTSFPLYVMADEDSGDIYVTAEDIAGFFVEPSKDSSEVVFVGVHEVGMGTRKTAEDAVLRVMNSRQERIGEYYIGRIVLGGAPVASPNGEVSAVWYRFFGNRCEHSAAAGVWRRWALGPALQNGEWLGWPASYHSAWLHVVQNSWFASGRGANRCGSATTVYMDGAHIPTREGFFCALGEAVNGPGGYFGSNLDALADCLSSNSRGGPPLEIVWRQFKTSQELLGRAFVDSVIGVMREFQAEVTAS